MNSQVNYDLERLKWLDPRDQERFARKDLKIPNGRSNTQNVSSEEVLESILQLIDEIFDHLSVFEQYSETTSRGAIADPKKKSHIPNVRNSLFEAENKLWEVYAVLKDQRSSFVSNQLKSLDIDVDSKGLKVHIGSGGHHLKDWLNIDAGGEDLALNVNWGLPLPTGCANYVYCAHLLEHIRFGDQAPVFVREVHRILTDGGIVRFVVPDIRKLIVAYVEKDRDFFASRQEFYPLDEGFLNNGVANLDYILLFCGAGSQVLNYNHKFGYDSTTLSNLLLSAGFADTKVCKFQSSEHVELRVDDFGYNAQAKNSENEHFSLFIEAKK